MPTSARSPSSMAPRLVPSTRTSARVTRWSRMRIARSAGRGRRRAQAPAVRPRERKPPDEPRPPRRRPVRAGTGPSRRCRRRRPWLPTIAAVSWLTPPSTWTRPRRPAASRSSRAWAIFGGRVRQEALAAPAGLDGHDHDDVEQVDVRSHGIDRRLGADGEPGAEPGVADRPQGRGVLVGVDLGRPRRGR